MFVKSNPPSANFANYRLMIVHAALKVRLEFHSMDYKTPRHPPHRNVKCTSFKQQWKANASAGPSKSKLTMTISSVRNIAAIFAIAHNVGKSQAVSSAQT